MESAGEFFSWLSWLVVSIQLDQLFPFSRQNFGPKKQKVDHCYS